MVSASDCYRLFFSALASVCSSAFFLHSFLLWIFSRLFFLFLSFLLFCSALPLPPLRFLSLRSSLRPVASAQSVSFIFLAPFISFVLRSSFSASTCASDENVPVYSPSWLLFFLFFFFLFALSSSFSLLPILFLSLFQFQFLFGPSALLLP